MEIMLAVSYFKTVRELFPRLLNKIKFTLFLHVTI